jgi:hypothetical protein
MRDAHEVFKMLPCYVLFVSGEECLSGVLLSHALKIGEQSPSCRKKLWRRVHSHEHMYPMIAEHLFLSRGKTGEAAGFSKPRSPLNFGAAD